MDVAVSMVVLLHAWIHVRIHARLDTRVNRWVQQTSVAWSSLHRGDNGNILHRGMVVLVVVLCVLKMLRVLEVLVVELLLVLRLEVLILLRLEMVMIKKLRLVSDSGSSGSGGGSTTVTVQRLFHQRSGVLCSLLLAADSGKVRFWRMVVRRVDHTQNPHLRVLLVVVVVCAVEFVGLLLHLLSLVLLWRVQVGHQSVSTLASLGVRHSLSLGSVLDGGSERARSLALEVHSLWLRRVDDNLALFLFVEHSLDILDQVLLTGESLDNVAFAVSRHKEAAILVVNPRGGECHGVLVLWQLLAVQLLLVQLLLQVVLLLQRVLLQVLVLQVLVLQVLLLQVLLLHLLLLHLRGGGSAHVNATVVLALVVVVAHDGSRVGEVMPVGQRNGGGGGVVQLLLVVEVLLLQVLVLRSEALASGSFV